MNYRITLIAAVSAISLALAGCSGAPAAQPDGIRIVASTSVYGDIAASIVGDFGSVTSLISGSTVDPHSFEASARDQLSIADADLVIANGGGYDPFVDALLEASGSKATVITAVDASGLLDDTASHDHSNSDDAAPADGHDHVDGFNEHVWYSFHGMTHLVEQIAQELGVLDPSHKTAFDANAGALSEQIEGLEARADELAVHFAGDGAAVTEPVPVYLLEAVGLKNLTPTDFTEAIEEGNDVPPLALEATLELLAKGSVRMLAYNEQTASPETERVREAAVKADIPVVQFTETLPDGSDYVSWMSDNLDALAVVTRP